jgi:hypothetical protein
MGKNSDLYRHQCIRPIPEHIFADKVILYNELEQWEHAIQFLLNSVEHQHNHDKLTLMRIHNRTGLTLLESSLHVEECLLDNYRWAFEDIVNYTAELQERPYHSDEESSIESASPTPEPRPKASNSNTSPSLSPKSNKTIPRRRPLFLLDNGLIFSLYWTALKSRSGPLRRRAISLLESSSQEGVWIGPIQAAIAKRVIEVEEQRPYEQDPPLDGGMEEGDIEEGARVHSVGTDIDKANKRARVVLLLREKDDWRERIEWVSW